MTTAVVAFLLRLFCGPTVRYLHDLGGPPRSRVFFANHSSHLDFLLIWAMLPSAQRRRSHPVAARDYWSQGRVRRFIAGRFFGGLMIERRNPTAEDNPVEQMLAVLDEQESLILFPEGTRGPGDVVAPFKSGLFRIYESRPAVELIPVFLENLNRILPKGEFLPLPLLSYITFGAPLARKADEKREEFLERARQTLVALEAG